VLSLIELSNSLAVLHLIEILGCECAEFGRIRNLACCQLLSSGANVLSCM
jgi:hypothetical protein